MHYCFFTSGSWEGNGGLQRLRELGSALIEQGVRVSYLLDREPFNLNELQLHAAAERVWVPADQRHGRGWGSLLARRRILRALAPDYVHVLLPSMKAFGTLAGLRGGIKVIGDWDEWPARRPQPFWSSAAARFLDRWLRRRSHRVLVASRYMQQRFRKQFACEAIHLPHAAFVAAQPDGSSPFSQPTAVYMGTFYDAYDHDVLFDAAELLKRDRHFTPSIEMIGDGPELEQWRAWTAERGLENIRLAGYLRGSELWRHVRHAHVLLFPMRSSAVNLSRCPGKLFYYAQARRPTIATRVGEIPEVLEEKAEYVDCTPAAFADAIERAMTKPHLPDVDYRLQTWEQRARTLLDALSPRAGGEIGAAGQFRAHARAGGGVDA